MATNSSHEHDVEFRGPIGDVSFEVMYIPLHELEQLANQYFSEPDYQEDSRSNLDNPSGYMSIGNLSDGARQARAIIGTDKAGLVRLEATADSEEDLDQHLEQNGVAARARNRASGRASSGQESQTAPNV